MAFRRQQGDYFNVTATTIGPSADAAAGRPPAADRDSRIASSARRVMAAGKKELGRAPEQPAVLITVGLEDARAL